MYHIQSRIKILLLAAFIFCSTRLAAQVTMPAPYSSSIKLNYTRFWEVTAPLSNTDTIKARPLADVIQTTQYQDGLGRPLQTVVRQATPAGKDLVIPAIYDSFNRVQLNYLPFASNNFQSGDINNDGGFKLDAFQQDSVFNQSQYPGENFFYAQVDYESSPLNRVQKKFSPGKSWVGSRGTAAEKGRQFQYLINTVSDSVRVWQIAYSTGSLPTSSKTFAAGQLYKTVSYDEAGHQIMEYQNLLGQLILKKVQSTGTPGTAHAGWLCTYYVYDDVGNLRFIMQPKAVEWLMANAWNFGAANGSTVANELCFRYEYDLRKRLVVKKIPGAGENRMVYDSRDRLVLTQDSVLRSQNQWLFVKYDALDRRICTGLYTDATHTTQASMQSYLNSLGMALYETYSTTTSQGYSLTNSFPSTVIGNVLTFIYYNDYTWSGWYGSYGSKDNSYDGNFLTASNTVYPYPQALTQSVYTSRSLVTGIWDNTGRLTALYYDDRARVIQTKYYNVSGGVDINTIQYDYAGRTLRTYMRHQKSASNPQTHTVLTKMQYDPAGRLVKVWKNLDNASSDQLIDTMKYNEIGQLKAKYIGNNIDSMVYDYNIRGWMVGINRNYLNGTFNHFFGMELGYDKTTSITGTTSYAHTQFAGKIAGTIWKTAGDGVGRKYDYTYDTANRVTRAEFTQNNSGAWDATKLNFSVTGFDADNGNGIKYDANGNILQMIQSGWKAGSTTPIDGLHYTYTANSNKLQQVTDDNNDANSKIGDFHYSGTKQSSDYAYDGNGNLTLDNNRAIGSITYNYLGLPTMIHTNGKGNIQYTYDAFGIRLQKIITDSAANKKTIISYLGSFVYQSTSTLTGTQTDTLQYLFHEEGRIRYAYHKYTNGTTGYKFEYDYFLRDNLGNVRMVLTQQKDTFNYLATMEAAYRSTELQLFTNIANTSYARSLTPGTYPTDNTTTPNDSVSRLNGSLQRSGPGLLLKVMSGDTISVAVKSYYVSQTGTGTTPSINDILNSLATGIVNMTQGTKGSLAQLNTTTSPLYNALNSFQGANNPTPSGKPKAYLNWILFDEQFNYVGTFPQSGAIPVGNYAAGTLGTPGQSGIPITKNGYMYIYVSNETQNWDVFFDNLSVQHKSGPILEESHYYPFGLAIAPLCSKALKANYIENKLKYNQGSELQSGEFSDGSGLDEYASGYRNYDPQIGRFHQVDPLADLGIGNSPYVYCSNSPALYTDPLGTFEGQKQAPAYGTLEDLLWAITGGGTGDFPDGLTEYIVNPDGTLQDPVYDPDPKIGSYHGVQGLWFTVFSKGEEGFDGHYNMYTDEFRGGQMDELIITNHFISAGSLSLAFQNYNTPSFTDYLKEAGNLVLGGAELASVFFTGGLTATIFGVDGAGRVVNSLGKIYTLATDGKVQADRLPTNLGGDIGALIEGKFGGKGQHIGELGDDVTVWAISGGVVGDWQEGAKAFSNEKYFEGITHEINILGSTRDLGNVNKRVNEIFR